MKHKEYSHDIWIKIEKALQKQIETADQPIAAFDADGTLWDTDLGESFFDFQIKNKLISLPANPWQHYLSLQKINNDPRPSYLWLAQICKNQTLSQVRSWAEEATAEFNPFPIFDEQKKLVELLLRNGVEVFIVTASIKWAVEPGARRLGIPIDNVIGVETEVVNNIITDKQKGVITYKQGKVEALLQKTNGKQPFLSAGNTTGDLYLLESSTDIQLAVRSVEPKNRHYQAEQELYKIAKEKSWLHHQF